MKKRLIAKIVVKDGIVVQSINFKKFLPVGSIENAIEYFNNWIADEIILIDISNQVNFIKNLKIISEISLKNRTPLCYGGGIKKISDVELLLRAGVDKVSINSYSLINKKLIKEISNVYGSQCLIVSLDIKKINKKYYIFDHKNKKYLDLTFAKIQEYEKCGLGEFFIQSIDNDGSKTGFNYNLLKIMLKLTNKPIIFSSGYGSLSHLKKICNTQVSGIAIGNALHFKETSIINLKFNTNKFFKKNIFRLDDDFLL
jgi:imidazole glycerol-phosphate synthase subunit HisF